MKKVDLSNLPRSAKILVLHTANLGDVISGSIVIDFLKKHFDKVNVYIRTPFQGLFAGDDQVIELKEVIKEKYDLVVDLDSTKVSRTLARKVGSPIKVGMWYTRLRKIKYSFLYSHQAQKLKTGKIVRDYDPVIELMGGVPQQRPQISQWDEPSAIQWIKSNINSPYVVMHFSSLIPVRQLPDELLFPIINFIKKQSLQLILIGVEKDTILEVVDKYSGYPLFNVFNIKELKTIIGHSCFYIGTDSGPLHLAAALNKNGIGFYGPELAKNCGNISDKIITFEKDFSCRPCDQNQPCPYNQRCLKSFDIESITSALDNLQSFAGKLST